ncbi:VWA domain-containing protein [Microbacterium sp. MEC084]|uniref:VWA domain-containing protein n=1 Tax=Microbacterium sp. MEC084 TaxID=1963027 RepID=UPI00106FC133|nr:VWA domain-containing protein [Microbacterium sp. MEC084]MCD1269977.1 VWA domain-containing protein [Microbacterium sp. MEC084]
MNLVLQPVLHPLLLILIAAAGLFVTVRCVVTAPDGRTRTAWIVRTVTVLACLVLALRPGIPGGQSQTLTTDTDVVILVDSTASIVAEDWADGAPRLDGVREDVAALVAEYPGARFALITFDASAELRLPLTTDTAALRSAMEVLRPEPTQNSRGSSIGIAADLLEETLRNAAASSERSRMVFYLGDGEQTAASQPESFRGGGELVDGGAVFGYGTAEGGRMKVQTGGLGEGADEYIQDGDEPALSRIDEDALRTIAADLGVEYQHRTPGTEPSLPAAPTSTTTQPSGSTGDVTDLSWIVALMVVGLLAVDAALLAGAIPGILRIAGRRAEGGAP